MAQVRQYLQVWILSEYPHFHFLFSFYFGNLKINKQAIWTADQNLTVIVLLTLLIFSLIFHWPKILQDRVLKERLRHKKRPINKHIQPHLRFRCSYKKRDYLFLPLINPLAHVVSLLSKVPSWHTSSEQRPYNVVLTSCTDWVVSCCITFRCVKFNQVQR